MKNKFRAKHIDTNQWIYGQLLELSGSSYIIRNDKDNGYFCVPVDPKTVTMFTNCVDANGKDIYEGDIVECVSWNEYWSTPEGILDSMRRNMTVTLKPGKFVLVEHYNNIMADSEFDMISNGDVNIVGNIFDNPEKAKVNVLNQYLYK